MSASLDEHLHQAHERFKREHDALRDALIASLPTQPPSVEQWGRIAARRRLMGATIMKDRTIRLAVAAIIAVAVVIGVNPFGGDPRPAFADTMEQIEKAHSVVFLQTFCHEDGTKRFASRQMVNEMGILRTEMEHGTVLISDYTRGVTVQLEPSQKHAILTYRIGEKRRTPLSTHLSWARTLHRGGKLVDREKIDGRMTNVFFADLPFKKTTVWVDPQTDLPVRAQRIEIRNPRADIVIPSLSLDLRDFGGDECSVSSMSGSDASRGIQRGQIILYTDFVWNTDLDESLFSLEPPAGYTVERTQHDATDKGDLCLIEALSLWTEMSGGAFPSNVDDLVDPNLITPLLIARFDRDGDPKEELRQAMAAGNVLLKASWFAQRHKADDNWWYAGDGVSLGDADKAICWWKQEDAETYRVIYGNLHIDDADEAPHSP